MTQTALKISGLYLLLVILWIWGSEYIPLQFKPSFEPNPTFLGSLKGGGLLILTAYFIYLLAKRPSQGNAPPEELYKMLFDESPVATLLLENNSHRILDANKAACIQYSYSKDELLQLNLQALCSHKEEDLNEWINFIQEKNNTSPVHQHIRKDGTRFYTKIFASGPVHLGRTARLVMLPEVHEKVTTEEKNKEAKSEIQKLSLVAQETQNAVIITDKEGYIEWVNEAFVRQTGYQREEVRGRKPGSFLQGPATDQETIHIIRENIRKQKRFKTELINYRKDGSTFWIRMFISPIFNEKGELEEYIAIETDITERKLFIEQLEKQNKQLRDIAWISSHEIRGPVASILGLVNLYDSKNPDAPFNKEVIQHLSKVSRDLDDVIHRIVHKASEVDEIETPQFTARN